MTHCELCLANAGQTNANRECCQIRMLAQMPANRMEPYAAKLTASEKDQLRPLLIAEKKRLRELAKSKSLTGVRNGRN